MNVIIHIAFFGQHYTLLHIEIYRESYIIRVYSRIQGEIPVEYNYTQ